MKTDVISFARSMRPELRAQAETIEQARGLPADLAKKLARGGLFGLFTPSWLGGLELKPETGLRALEETAKGDMSAAWAAMISSTSALGAAWVEPDAAREIFSNPDLILAGVAAPMGKAKAHGANYKVSGTWQWGSGSNNADYFIGGCLVDDGGEHPQRGERPQHRMLIFPKEKLALGNNWFVMGLSGSSSNDVNVVECEIPKSHSFSVVLDKPNNDGALYKMPFFGFLACGIAACALGNVGALLDDVLALAKEKTPTGTKSSLGAKSYIQIDIAKQSAALDSARGGFYSLVNQMWEIAQTNKPDSPSDHDKARLRLAAMTATYSAAQIATELHHLAGGTSVFSSSPIQRRLRDSQIATQHRMVSPTNYQIIGKILLGLADKKAIIAAAL